MFCTIISNMESWKEVKAAPLRKVTIVRVESWLHPTLAVWLSGKWQNVAGVIPEGGRAGTPYCGPCACLCTLFASSQLHRQGGERSRVFIASDQPPSPLTVEWFVTNPSWTDWVAKSFLTKQEQICRSLQFSSFFQVSVRVESRAIYKELQLIMLCLFLIRKL